MRSGDLVEHYTDRGIVPRAAFEAHPMGRLLPFVSLHLAHGSVAWKVALFAAAAAAGVSLTLGFRTRLATVLSWLLLLSVQHRNPLLHYGGDNFLAVILFWCLLLPLGARWSLDARRAASEPSAGRVFSWASAGLLVQIASTHWFSVFHKRGVEWTVDGSAVYYALHMDGTVRPLGLLLREHELLLRLLTHATLLLEAVGPLLLFCPWRFPAPRMLAVAGFVGLHLGIGATMDLLQFSWLAAFTMTAFLPPWFWDDALPPLGLRTSTAPATADAPSPGRLPLPLRWMAAAALVFVLVYNVLDLRTSWLEAVERHPVLQWALLPGHALRLGQSWYMFSPHPPKFTTWNVVVGVLEDGRRVDLLRGLDRPPDFAKPASPSDYFPSRRWERVFSNAWDSEYVDAWSALGRYYCRTWNDAHPEPVVEVRIFRRRERNEPGQPPKVGPARLEASFDCRRPAQPARVPARS